VGARGDRLAAVRERHPAEEPEADDLIAYSGESGNARGMAAADQHVHLETRSKAYTGVGLANRVSLSRATCPLTQPIDG
jgi:hypothetical protein